MPLLESTPSKWSHNEAGTALKHAHLSTGAALRRQAAPGLDVPSEPHLSGDLAIDYAQRWAIVMGVSVDLLDVEQRLRWVWGQDSAGGSSLVRTIVERLRLTGDRADTPPTFSTSGAAAIRWRRARARMEAMSTLGARTVSDISR